MKRMTIEQQRAAFKDYIESTKPFKITCRAKWFDEPLSLTTENVIQTIRIRGIDEKDAIRRLEEKFNGKYSVIKIEEAFQ
jgi:hypothetical protein